jgi:hypothetical protein
VSEPIDPQKHLRRMWETAPKLAEAKANRVYMEEYRKTLKALLMKQSGAKSAVEQERDAYSHDDYRAHLDGLRAAVEQEELLRWRMVTDQASVEVWRSQESSARAMDRGTK